MTQPKTRSRRATAPKPVRQVARAAGLSLEKLAEAVVDGQPPPERPRDQAALLEQGIAVAVNMRRTAA
jgi:hypothetical protein